MTTSSHADRLRRARPVIALAAVAFAVGAIVGSSNGTDSHEALAARYASAWARGDYTSLFHDIDRRSRLQISAQQLAEGCRQALRTATATAMKVAGGPHGISGGLIAVPVRVRTRLFGTLRLAFALKVVGGQRGGVVWSHAVEFPGLRPGEQLTRRVRLPPRASLLAREGSVLAEGTPTEAGQRPSPLGVAGSAAVGEVGAAPGASARALEAEGVPAGAIVGVSGLEHAFDPSLRGTAGGELLAQSEAPGAGARVLAAAAARKARSVQTTISPAVQQAAVSALGSQLGGVVAMRPNGQILAVAGLGIDDLQPPGSTFKMVTVSAALQAGVASLASTFPYATYATLDGVTLNNAGGEECGGSLELAFAVSCNSVFAPLGVKIGAARLVAMAERYGFNHEPGIAGAAESTLPRASQIQGELDVGSTAIGQGQVLASALQMATIAATIGDSGHRPQPTFLIAARPSVAATATSAALAATVRRLMIAVVREGTGTAAAISGVTVAGKTGTAELGTCPSGGAPGEGGGKQGAAAASGCNEAADTDAWFAAFAPAVHPRIVVGVMLVKDGAGGATAAPVARQVLEAGLQPGS